MYHSVSVCVHVHESMHVREVLILSSDFLQIISGLPWGHTLLTRETFTLNMCSGRGERKAKDGKT